MRIMFTSRGTLPGTVSRHRNWTLQFYPISAAQGSNTSLFPYSYSYHLVSIPGLVWSGRENFYQDIFNLIFYLVAQTVLWKPCIFLGSLYFHPGSIWFNYRAFVTFLLFVSCFPPFINPHLLLQPNRCARLLSVLSSKGHFCQIFWCH